MRDIIKLKKLRSRFIVVAFLMMLMPIIAFAFTRGQDGYNYYNYNQNPIGGKIFGGSSFGNGGGGLFCSGGSSYPTFCSIIDSFLGLIKSSIPILISISVIVFVWGVFRYVIAEGEDRQKSKDIILYGIIGLFVMVSVWGLVALVYNTFGLDNTSNFFFRGGGGGVNTTNSFSEFGKQFIPFR